MNTRAKPPTHQRQLLVGGPLGGTELPTGSERAYRVPLLVLFDVVDDTPDQTVWLGVGGAVAMALTTKSAA
ncbi:hypothetical protein FHT44_001367 [Mycolicibacterium sp. BK634]|nr:hypothetical protein [Mycolicibacterium sp. BK634]